MALARGGKAAASLTPRGAPELVLSRGVMGFNLLFRKVILAAE